MPQLSFDLLFDQTLYIVGTLFILCLGLTVVLDTAILLRYLYCSSVLYRNQRFIIHINQF